MHDELKNPNCLGNGAEAHKGKVSLDRPLILTRRLGRRELQRLPGHPRDHASPLVQGLLPGQRLRMMIAQPASQCGAHLLRRGASWTTILPSQGMMVDPDMLDRALGNCTIGMPFDNPDLGRGVAGHAVDVDFEDFEGHAGRVTEMAGLRQEIIAGAGAERH